MEPLLPADSTDPEALRRALLEHTTEVRRGRVKRSVEGPLSSLAWLVVLGTGVAALLVGGGLSGRTPLPEGWRQAPPPAVQRPAGVRGL